MLQYFAVAALAASSLAVTPAKAKWQADYGKALSATRSDQRPLLVVIDNPADPAASVQEELLSTEGEQGSLLKPYRLCRVDISTDYGKKVAEAFGATQFPHTTIIDKTGRVVLFKKPGQIEGSEWKTTLAKFEKGEQVAPTTSYFRGNTILGASAQPVSNGSYCPSCQRKAMGL
jgi:hypothetical protein